MSKGNTTENDVVLMVLKGTDPSWRGNANRYISLHTADPGEAGSQTTSECAYGSYARVAVATSAWTVASGAGENTNLIQFPTCTSGSETATYFAVGTLSSGAGQILYSGALSASLAISSGIQPQFAAGDLDITED